MSSHVTYIIVNPLLRKAAELIQYYMSFLIKNAKSLTKLSIRRIKENQKSEIPLTSVFSVTFLTTNIDVGRVTQNENIICWDIRQNELQSINTTLQLYG